MTTNQTETTKAPLRQKHAIPFKITSQYVKNGEILENDIVKAIATFIKEKREVILQLETKKKNSPLLGLGYFGGKEEEIRDYLNANHLTTGMPLENLTFALTDFLKNSLKIDTSASQVKRWIESNTNTTEDSIFITSRKKKEGVPGHHLRQKLTAAPVTVSEVSDEDEDEEMDEEEQQ